MTVSTGGNSRPLFFGNSVGDICADVVAQPLSELYCLQVPVMIP